MNCDPFYLASHVNAIVGLVDQFQESAVVTVLVKDRIAIVTTIENVVTSVGGGSSGSSRHQRILKHSNTTVKKPECPLFHCPDLSSSCYRGRASACIDSASSTEFPGRSIVYV